MTITQFKILLQQGGFLDNPQKEVIINYEGTIIKTIAVRVGKYELLQLQQATAIVLKVPALGTVLNIPLENQQIPPRQVDRSIVGNYFVYDFVGGTFPMMSTTPTQNTPIGSLEEYNTEVIIIPGKSVEKFAYSEYEVLLNSVETNATSTYIQVSDRTALEVLPGNFNNIISGTADLAEIQDSNYTDTGWTSGRYIGTGTNSTTYGGIDPAITGKSFSGSLYSTQISDSTIISQADTERTYQTYLYTGPKEIASFSGSVTSTNYITSASATSTSTEFYIIPLYSAPLSVEVGDVIFIYNSSEKMKLQNITPITPQKYKLTVIRGWNNTTAVPIQAGDEVRRIRPSYVYLLDNAKVTPTGESKVRVKDTQEILYLDISGMIISGSNIS